MRYHKSRPSIAVGNRLLGRRQRDRTSQDIIMLKTRVRTSVEESVLWFP